MLPSTRKVVDEESINATIQQAVEISQPLHFSIDCDNQEVNLPPHDNIAVITMSLYLLERHWEHLYREAWKSCCSMKDKECLRELHHIDIARIENARLYLKRICVV